DRLVRGDRLRVASFEEALTGGVQHSSQDTGRNRLAWFEGSHRRAHLSASRQRGGRHARRGGHGLLRLRETFDVQADDDAEEEDEGRADGPGRPGPGPTGPAPCRL